MYRYNAAWWRGMWSCGILVTRREREIERERPALLLTTSSSQYIIVYNLDIITRTTRARTTQTLPLRIKIHICIQVSSSLYYYYYYSAKDIICLFGFLFWHKSVRRRFSPDLSTSIFDRWQNDYNYQRVPECRWWRTNWRRRVCTDWISLFVSTFTHLRRKKTYKTRFGIKHRPRDSTSYTVCHNIIIVISSVSHCR